MTSKYTGGPDWGQEQEEETEEMEDEGEKDATNRISVGERSSLKGRPIYTPTPS